MKQSYNKKFKHGKKTPKKKNLFFLKKKKFKERKYLKTKTK
jgi:hypothetical protein